MTAPGSVAKYHFTSTSFVLTCWCVCEGGGVVAQLLPLLAAAVDPNAEAHKDDPAGSANACNERWLLDHIGDLLRQTHTVLLAAVAVAAASTAASTAARCGGLFRLNLWEKKVVGEGQNKTMKF